MKNLFILILITLALTAKAQDISTDWTIENGVDSVTMLNKRYVVDAYTIQVLRPNNQHPKITVHLREQIYTPNGAVVEDETAGYQVVKGKARTHYDGTLMPKLDSLGQVVYTTDSLGNQVPVLGRYDSYERVIYSLENGLFTKQVAIQGIKEYYKIE